VPRLPSKRVLGPCYGMSQKVDLCYKGYRGKASYISCCAMLSTLSTKVLSLTVYVVYTHLPCRQHRNRRRRRRCHRHLCQTTSRLHDNVCASCVRCHDANERLVLRVLVQRVV